MNKYGKRLRDLRDRYGYTQEELAKLLNISRSRLAMYEQGQREPDFEMQEAFADFFNVTIDYLFGRETEKVKDALNDFNYPQETVEAAMNFYSHYNDSTPEIREAVRTLLKLPKSDP